MLYLNLDKEANMKNKNYFILMKYRFNNLYFILPTCKYQKGEEYENHLSIHGGGAYAACHLQIRKGTQNDFGVHRFQRQRPPRRHPPHARQPQRGGTGGGESGIRRREPCKALGQDHSSRRI